MTLSRALREASQVPMMASVRPWVSGFGGIGIDLGGVEDGDAAIERVVHLGVAFGFACSAGQRSWCRGRWRSHARRCGRARDSPCGFAQYWWRASWATWPPKTMIVDPTDKPSWPARLPSGRRGRGRGDLLEGLPLEQRNPQLPENKGQDRKERNNPENFTVMQRHDPSLSLAPRPRGRTWTSIGTNCKARWKALGRARLTAPASEAIGARYRGAASWAVANPLRRAGAARDVLVVCSTFRDHRELPRLARPGLTLSVP